MAGVVGPRARAGRRWAVLRARHADEEDGLGAPAGGEAITRADVARIARGVERIRELEFERLPELRLPLLGLLPAGAGLRDLRRAAQTRWPATTCRVPARLRWSRGWGWEVSLGEVTGARAGPRAGGPALRPRCPPGPAARDRDAADAALHEGTATGAMVDYLLAERGVREPPQDLRARVLEQIAEVAIPSASGLPRYFREGLVFPYAAARCWRPRARRRRLGSWPAPSATGRTR